MNEFDTYVEIHEKLNELDGLKEICLIAIMDGKTYYNYRKIVNQYASEKESLEAQLVEATAACKELVFREEQTVKHHGYQFQLVGGRKTVKVEEVEKLAQRIAKQMPVIAGLILKLIKVGKPSMRVVPPKNTTPKPPVMAPDAHIEAAQDVLNSILD